MAEERSAPILNALARRFPVQRESQTTVLFHRTCDEKGSAATPSSF
jgi:hypothetical protein